MAFIEPYQSPYSSHKAPHARETMRNNPRENLQALTFFRSGAEIYAQGEKSGKLYQVEFGAVRIHRLLADGRRQILAFHLPGETFGLEPDATHHFFAEAICNTTVRVIRTSSYKGETAARLLPLALQTMVRAHEHLLVLGRQNAIERIAAFITDMSERQGDLRQIELPMSRLDIADYLGLTIETISRAFTKLRHQGVIELPTLRSVNILKRQALKMMAS